MTLIMVMDNDCAIGKNGGLLCRLPEDMKNFRETTKNSTVIMGRKTWDSFPKKPLPGRENLILSRSMEKADGARVFHDAESLLEYIKDKDGKERVFVIGGAEIYRLLEPYCDEAVITRVYENFGGDAFFHEITDMELSEVSPVIETGGRNIRFFRYRRTK